MIEFTKYPTEEVWTSYVPDVTITTDTTGKVVFTLYHGGFPDGETVFENAFYASGGEIVISGLGEVISTYMRSKSLTTASFTMKASEGSTAGESALASFTAFYCTRAMTESVRTWAARHFLTTAQSAVMSEKESLRLSAICAPGETTVTITAVGRTETGEIAQCPFNGSLTLQDTDALQVVALPTITPQLVLQQASTLGKLRSLLSFTVCHGARSLQVFVRQQPEDTVAFRFLNTFGIEESITLRGVIKKTLELTRGETIAAQTTHTYDITGYRTYELTSSPMPEDEAARVEQLVESWRVTDSAGRRLIIANTDFAYDTDSATLKTVTLQWRYAYRKIVEETQTDETAGVFSDPFTYQFS